MQLLPWIAGGLAALIALLAIYLRPPMPGAAAAATPTSVEATPKPMIAGAMPTSARATPKLVIAARTPRAVEPSGFEDALSFALEASDPYVQTGRIKVQEDYWGGKFLSPGNRLIEHELIAGNEYWIWLGSSSLEAKISVHVYDSGGHLAESDAWQKSRKAGAHVIPKETGAYRFIVDVRGDAFAEPGSSVDWGVVYGFRVRH